MATGHIRWIAPINQDRYIYTLEPVKHFFAPRRSSRIRASQNHGRWEDYCVLCARGRLVSNPMDAQEILSRLERNEGRFPEAAIREAVARRDEIISPLLEVLEAVGRNPEAFVRDGDRMIHIYAVYLLAQFQEPRAYPLLVRIFSAPGELAF